MLKNKTILLGVTGSIAAYKIASLASALVKTGANVHVLMTENATNFINPITFETLTGHKCLVNTFDRNFEFSVEHVSLAKQADVVLIAPASANVIGKMANGIADDMVTTTVLACKCPIIVSPAMNTAMYENPIVQDNLSKLESYGMIVIDPASGYLACGDTGAGKMPEPETLLSYLDFTIGADKDLKGKNILITAGATREAIDPVRFITNHSTGRMGIALAKAAAMRGAKVTLVLGAVSIEEPDFVDIVHITSARDLFEAVRARYEEQDAFILCAAVADMTPANTADEKIKKANMTGAIEVKPTPDTLAWLGSHCTEDQMLIGFSMETENVIEHSRAKLEKKNCDMIVANNLKEKGAGFGTDTNIVTMITKDNAVEYPLMSKEEVAMQILDYCI